MNTEETLKPTAAQGLPEICTNLDVGTGDTAAGHRRAPLRCKVSGCLSDLSSAPKTHQRFRLCNTHIKAPAILVDGAASRFCQQCSRFHPLADFNGTNRTCRMMLAKNRARQRGSALGITSPVAAAAATSAAVGRKRPSPAQLLILQSTAMPTAATAATAVAVPAAAAAAVTAAAAPHAVATDPPLVQLLPAPPSQSAAAQPFLRHSTGTVADGRAVAAAATSPGPIEVTASASDAAAITKTAPSQMPYDNRSLSFDRSSAGLDLPRPGQSLPQLPSGVAVGLYGTMAAAVTASMAGFPASAPQSPATAVLEAGCVLSPLSRPPSALALALASGCDEVPVVAAAAATPSGASSPSLGCRADLAATMTAASRFAKVSSDSVDAGKAAAPVHVMGGSAGFASAKGSREPAAAAAARAATMKGQSPFARCSAPPDLCHPDSGCGPVAGSGCLDGRFSPLREEESAAAAALHWRHHRDHHNHHHQHHYNSAPYYPYVPLEGSSLSPQSFQKLRQQQRQQQQLYLHHTAGSRLKATLERKLSLQSILRWKQQQQSCGAAASQDEDLRRRLAAARGSHSNSSGGVSGGAVAGFEHMAAAPLQLLRDVDCPFFGRTSAPPDGGEGAQKVLRMELRTGSGSSLLGRGSLRDLEGLQRSGSFSSFKRRRCSGTGERDEEWGPQEGAGCEGGGASVQRCSLTGPVESALDTAIMAAAGAAVMEAVGRGAVLGASGICPQLARQRRHEQGRQQQQQQNSPACATLAEAHGTAGGESWRCSGGVGVGGDGGATNCASPLGRRPVVSAALGALPLSSLPPARGSSSSAAVAASVDGTAEGDDGSGCDAVGAPLTPREMTTLFLGALALDEKAVSGHADAVPSAAAAEAAALPAAAAAAPAAAAASPDNLLLADLAAQWRGEGGPDCGDELLLGADDAATAAAVVCLRCEDLDDRLPWLQLPAAAPEMLAPPPLPPQPSFVTAGAGGGAVAAAGMRSCCEPAFARSSAAAWFSSATLPNAGITIDPWGPGRSVAAGLEGKAAAAGAPLPLLPPGNSTASFRVPPWLRSAQSEPAWQPRHDEAAEQQRLEADCLRTQPRFEASTAGAAAAYICGPEGPDSNCGMPSPLPSAAAVSAAAAVGPSAAPSQQTGCRATSGSSGARKAVGAETEEQLQLLLGDLINPGPSAPAPTAAAAVPLPLPPSQLQVPMHRALLMQLQCPQPQKHPPQLQLQPRSLPSMAEAAGGQDGGGGAAAGGSSGMLYPASQLDQQQQAQQLEQLQHQQQAQQFRQQQQQLGMWAGVKDEAGGVLQQPVETAGFPTGSAALSWPVGADAAGPCPRRDRDRQQQEQQILLLQQQEQLLLLQRAQLQQQQQQQLEQQLRQQQQIQQRQQLARQDGKVIVPNLPLRWIKTGQPPQQPPLMLVPAAAVAAAALSQSASAFCAAVTAAAADTVTAAAMTDANPAGPGPALIPASAAAVAASVAPTVSTSDAAPHILQPAPSAVVAPRAEGAGVGRRSRKGHRPRSVAASNPAAAAASAPLAGGAGVGSREETAPARAASPDREFLERALQQQRQLWSELRVMQDQQQALVAQQMQQQSALVKLLKVPEMADAASAAAVAANASMSAIATACAIPAAPATDGESSSSPPPSSEQQHHLQFQQQHHYLKLQQPQLEDKNNCATSDSQGHGGRAVAVGAPLFGRLSMPVLLH